MAIDYIVDIQQYSVINKHYRLTQNMINNKNTEQMNKIKREYGMRTVQLFDIKKICRLVKSILLSLTVGFDRVDGSYNKDDGLNP